MKQEKNIKEGETPVNNVIIIDPNRYNDPVVRRRILMRKIIKRVKEQRK